MLRHRKSIVLVLCVSLLGSAVSAEPGQVGRTGDTGTLTFADVTLNETGGLAGRFVDTQGQAVANSSAMLIKGTRPVAKTATDQTGAFYFPTVRPGVYRLSFGTESQMIRVWTPETSPPVAKPLLTMVRQQPIVRGQADPNIWTQVGIAAGVGGLIVAGVALVESDDAQDNAAAARRIRKVTSP